MYLRGLQSYWDNHDGVKIKLFYNDIYEWFVTNVFCNNNVKEFKERFGANLFSDGTDCKKLLEDYFNVKL